MKTNLKIEKYILLGKIWQFKKRVNIKGKENTYSMNIQK